MKFRKLSLLLARPADFRMLRILVVNVIKRIRADRITGLAAQMSFYFVLAIFPFLIVLAAMVSTLPFTGAWPEVLKWITLYFPAVSRNVVYQIVLGLTENRAGFLTLGIIGTIWSASSGLLSLTDSFDAVYEVKETRGLFKQLCLAVLMVLVLALLVVATFSLLIAGSRLDRWVAAHCFGLIPEEPLWRFTRSLASVLMLSLGLTFQDAVLPNEKWCWRRRRWGAAFTVVGWLVSSALFNLYSERLLTFNRTYGVLSVFVAIMVWIYILCLVTLVGGLINSELSKIAPAHS
jgi:membrane protein